ncbi:KamA family radical SAM protein [Gracilinema caldarium]|uniref:Lysine 2,3-aminomutase YodO family protein n=1 Tax=Gracilinema caldarium (strain ATCC 51460 / DSM 7334 / H1) TaxID=744872 RepID=F8EYW2_GRAC1|nr:KamA family radical SAM protein [Gracilinema caldarium]AEJ18908.1 lysine 2,3-aminomutase YodO family protein [Gracilinema caldarium DSM 7334]
MKLITRVSDLPPALADSVTKEESDFVDTLQAKGILPFAVTSYYADLANKEIQASLVAARTSGALNPTSGAQRHGDVLRRQFFPSPEEARILPYELEDPLGEVHFRVAPRLVHQYRDRVLLLANGTCAGYCRHCFRRSWTSTLQGFITPEELEPVKAYLSAHPEVREVLVSGGDPLMGSDNRLAELFTALRDARPGILLRIGSRIPIMAPERITADLVALLRHYRPLRLILHINHSKELALEVRSALSCLIEAGIPVHTQTVLLRGVNDTALELAELFRELLDLGVTPYYLFQGDLAPGTSHFRVNLERALSIYQELTRLISGLGLPAFAVDLPGGGGKVHLHPGCIEGEDEDPSGQVWYLLRSRDNTLWRYPKESN